MVYDEASNKTVRDIHYICSLFLVNVYKFHLKSAEVLDHRTYTC